MEGGGLLLHYCACRRDVGGGGNWVESSLINKDPRILLKMIAGGSPVGRGASF